MARKLLNGKELAGFIQQRQAKQVRMLRQAHGIIPKLVIIMSDTASPVIETYVRMKKRYGEDILIETDIIACQQSDMPAEIKQANEDASVYGIIVQLPIDDPTQTERIVNLIDPAKDVDGLGDKPAYASATAEAIDWLLAGYSVSLEDKRITLLGNGKLVGAPLAKLWQKAGYDVTVLDKFSQNIDETLLGSEVIVTATGKARILHDGNVPKNAIVVDAGTASEDGRVVGDSAPELQVRQDIMITPPKGGVGPLTVVVLFDHVIQACLATTKVEQG